MNAWTTIRLDECCEIVSGATPSTSVPEFWDGDIYWATPKDLGDLDGPTIDSTPRRITSVGLNSCAATILPVGSVLFSSRAPIGHVAINTAPMATNQGFKSLIPSKELEARYLYHWLRCNRSYLESLGNGATFKEVSKAVVARVEIPLPPLPEQRRIAAILDQADALRAKRREALAKLDEMAQAVFVEMFGDPLGNHPKRNVEYVRFEDIAARITYGFTSPMSHHDVGIPIVTAKNVRDGIIDLDRVHYADKVEFDALTDKSKPKKGDILITKDGTIGRCAVFEGTSPICINQSVALVQPDHTKVISSYVVAYLMTPTIQRTLKNMKKGNALQHLQITELAKFSIPLPPLREQAEFDSRRQSLEMLRGRLTASEQNFDSLFTSLQYRAFSGTL